MSNVIQFPKKRNVSRADELLIKLVEISDMRDQSQRITELNHLFILVLNHVSSLES